MDNLEQKKYLLEEMNALEVRNTVDKNSLAILVVGACENHGDHMPFGSDFIFPIKLIHRVIARILKKNIIQSNCVLLPVLPYGVSLHHDKFQMTMTLEYSTMILVLKDIFLSILNNGIRKILVINGHDGNIAPIEIAARTVKNLNPDVIISCLESWWVLVGQKNNSLFEVWNGLGHGGEAETSAMMAVRPDLVTFNSAPKTIIPNLPSDHVRIYWKFNELTQTGASGASRKASEKKGDQILTVLEEILVSFIEKMEKNDWKYGIDGNDFNEKS